MYYMIRWMYENPMDFTTLKGHQRPYLTHGAACTVVEIDCLTGQHKVYVDEVLSSIDHSTTFSACYAKDSRGVVLEIYFIEGNRLQSRLVG